MSEERKEVSDRGQQLTVRPGNIIPVHTEGFVSALRSFREKHTMVGVEGAFVPEDIRKFVQEISDLAYYVATPWITDASIVTPIADAKSFKISVRMKILGIAQLFARLAAKDSEVCMDAVNKVHSSLNEEEKMEALRRCIDSFRRSDDNKYAFLLALSTVTGALQANVPASIMPNTIKGRAGFFSG